jgi:hypothetical protein
MAVTVVIAALILLGVLWRVATINAAPAADCSNGNFVGTYQTDDVSLSGDLYVTNNVTIRNNVTLTITNGSNVTLCGEYKIRVTGGGDLVAVGTATEPITFMAVDPATNWDAIEFVNQGEHSILQYVTLNDGGGNDPNDDNAPIYVLNNSGTTALPSPSLDHVTINDSGAYGLSISMLNNDPTPPGITNVSINNSANAAILADAEALGGLGHGNSYTNNQPNVIRIRGGGGSRLNYSQHWRNPGIPIEVLGDFTVAAEAADPPATLTMDPGLTFLMYPETDVGIGSSLGRRGSLAVNGTEAEPVTFTRLDDVSAPWGALRVGLYSETTVSLDHVNFSYGGDGMDGMIYQLGSGAVDLDHVSVQISLSAGFYGHGGQATINNSSFELNDNGLEFSSGFSAIIRNSTIANNVTAGVNVSDNGNNTCIDAIGNFWGANNGPADGDGGGDACGNGRTNGGSGSKVTNGVRYSPWLTSNDGSDLQDRGSLSPDPFWVIADGVDSASVEIILRDSQGNPLSGKQVQLNATVGNVQQPSGVTDSNGRTTAVITGTNPGYAYLTAHNLTDDTPVAGIGGVAFWRGGENTGGLIDLSGAPYEFPELIVEGKPFQEGYPITFRLPMRNANLEPVEVQVVYGISGLNIGAPFTPVFTATRTLQPGDSWDAVGGWTPDVTGHHCVRATVVVTDVLANASMGVNASQAGGGFARQQNLNVKGAGPPGPPPCLFDCWPMPQPKKGAGALFEIGKHFYRMYNKVKAATDYINQALGDDPPVHGYEEVATVPQYTPPLVPAGDGITEAQAVALNAFDAASAKSIGLWLAVRTTVDRMAGASAAQAWGYVILQREALEGLLRDHGQALDEKADAIDDLLALTRDAGVPDLTFVPQDFQVELGRLGNPGFDSGEMAYFQAFGLSDEQIEDVRRNIIDQLKEGGFLTVTVYELMGAYSAYFKDTADDIMDQYAPPGAALNGRETQQTIQSGSPFWATGPVRESFLVGNPTDTEKTVELVVRPVEVPLGWTYSLDNPSPTLSPTATATVTLNINPGGAQLRGTTVRLAVEGFIDGEYIGGILFERIAPAAARRVFLPVVIRP